MNKDETNTQTNTGEAIEQDKEKDTTQSLRAIIREQTTEDEMPLTKNITLRKILGGDILSADIIRKQIWLILIIVLFIVVYISNRYKCQQDLILIDNLTEQLKDAKYRALSSSSDLTQQTRESKVLEKLRASSDSTLCFFTLITGIRFSHLATTVTCTWLSS